MTCLRASIIQNIAKILLAFGSLLNLLNQSLKISTFQSVSLLTCYMFREMSYIQNNIQSICLVYNKCSQETKR